VSPGYKGTFSLSVHLFSPSCVQFWSNVDFIFFLGFTPSMNVHIEGDHHLPPQHHSQPDSFPEVDFMSTSLRSGLDEFPPFSSSLLVV